jgi:hypothetical protein
MRASLIRSILVLLIAIIAIESVSVKSKLKSAACPKCLISEKQCKPGFKVVRKDDKNACEECPAGTEAPIECSKKCTCCTEGTFSNHEKTTKCQCCPIGE